MNDVVWVSLISAGGAVVAAFTAQFLAMKAAARQATRTAQQEALQWQRSEGTRRQALHDARLRELWSHVLTARWQVLDALERIPVKGRAKPERPEVSAATLPANAAAQAYAVALLGLADVRPGAKAFYLATSQLQLAMLAADEEQMTIAVAQWSESYKALEVSVAALADGLEDSSLGSIGTIQSRVQSFT